MDSQRADVELLRGKFGRFKADMWARVRRSLVAPIPMELHRRKLARFEADMRARRVRRSLVAPMFYGLFWSLGLPLRPPLFQDFVPLALQFGAFVTLPMGGGVALGYLLGALDAPTARFLVGAVPWIGMILGVSNAAYLRWWAAQWRLGSWEDYPADPPEDASYARETEQQGQRAMMLP